MPILRLTKKIRKWLLIRFFWKNLYKTTEVTKPSLGVIIYLITFSFIEYNLISSDLSFVTNKIKTKIIKAESTFKKLNLYCK